MFIRNLTPHIHLEIFEWKPIHTRIKGGAVAGRVFFPQNFHLISQKNDNFLHFQAVITSSCPVKVFQI